MKAIVGFLSLFIVASAFAAGAPSQNSLDQNIFNALKKAGGAIGCGTGAREIECSSTHSGDRCSLLLEVTPGNFSHRNLNRAQSAALVSVFIEAERDELGGCGNESCEFHAKVIDCAFPNAPGAAKALMCSIAPKVD